MLDHPSRDSFLRSEIFFTRSIRLTKAVCLDCEMVGIGDMGMDNMLARVSIVNQLGQCLYDKHVQPAETVVDYRTAVSGVTAEHLENGWIFF